MEISDENPPSSMPSSPRSDLSNSDSDAYNTASARIHFGPLRSPEKKYVPIADHCKTLQPNTLIPPLRRSPRLSTLVPGSPIMSAEETDENENGDGNDMNGSGYRSRDQSRSGTPENDIFSQDEPSSVLATKIIRAHDNPSPPPHARHHHGTISSHAMEPLNINAFITNRESGPAAELGLALCTDKPALPAIPLHTAFSIELKSNASQQDLISFDSLCAPLSAADIPTPNVPRTSTAAQPPTRTNRAPIDDFLSDAPPVPKVTVVSNTSSVPPSSLPPPLLSRTPLDAEIGNKDNGDPTDSADEHYIESALTYRDPEPFSRSTSPLIPLGTREEGENERAQTQIRNALTCLEHFSGSPPLVVLPPNPREEDQELLQTPIRRSSRSRSPYNFKTCDHLITGGGTASRSDQTQTPPQSRLLAPPPSAQTQKKRRKGKERAISPDDELVSDSPSGERRSRSTSTEPRLRTKGSVDVNLREADVEGLNGGKEKNGKERKEGTSGMTERGKQGLNRELGSLSPDSAALLTHLVPSTKASPVLQEAETWEAPTTPQPPTFTFSVFPQRQDGTFVIQGAPGPENPTHFTTPVRFAPLRSSSTVGSAALNDPDRTPARRIPIEQAIAQGQISPQKAVYFNARGTTSNKGIMRTPVFSRPTETPARRVPISETTPAKAQGSRQASPVRGTPKEKSGSVALKHLGAGKGRNGTMEQHEKRPQPWGAGSGLHLRPQSATPRSGSGSKLPFLIVPTHGPPNSIPEGDEGPPAPSDVNSFVKDHSIAPGSSTAKSSLRQHSVRSKIPRIGSKPYARPTVATPMELGKGKEKSTTARAIDLGANINAAHASKPFRFGGGSSSEDFAKNTPSNIGPNAASRAKAPTDTAIMANLKRKRGTETVSLVRQAHPMVITWQTGSGPHNSKQTSKVAAPLNLTPVKKAQESLVPFVDRAPNAPMGKITTQVPSGGTKDEADTAEVPVAKRHQIEEEDPMSVGLTSENLAPSSSPVHDIPASSQIRRDKSTNSESPLPSNNDSGFFGKVRRTTRLRKAPQPSSAADVFGTVDVRPLQPRRKVPHSSTQSETGAFSGMSAVALKTLTSSNTTRNQKYLAATLETEIIRKEGARPDSPTVKVKTLLQRQKEEKGKQRMERAARRARRSEDGSGMSDTDGQSDPVDSSLVDLDASWSDDGQDNQGTHHRKHRRGPGDEEDYESPDKPERPAKRLKCDEDGENVRAEKRRVKWDRGLSTTIYLDEVQPGTRARPKENLNAKGCLAKAAKALRLDTLGNLPNADTPLSDLVHENVIVKKFVYDNDAEPPTEEVYIVRSTRSRSKKAKS